MLPSALLLQPHARGRLVWLALACFPGLGHSFSPDEVELAVKRDWQAEQGPFFNDPRVEIGNSTKVDDSLNDTDELGQELGLPNPLSVVVSVLGNGKASSAINPLVGTPTQLAVPTPTAGSGGGLLGSVASILAGAPSAAPIAASSNPLGGLLSALSQVTPVVPVAATSALPAATPPVITPAPATTAGTGGLLAGLGVLGGVASALDGVLGLPGGANGDSGGGLLAQISSNVLAPIASVVADPAVILADPAAAVANLQSQVVAVLDSVPSAVAAGVQLASNVGGEVADVLDATNDVLSSAPDVAGRVADQVASLLHAAPDLATGLPAAALAAVSQVESLLTVVPALGDDITGLLDDLKSNLSSAVVNAIPEVTSLAAAVESQVVNVLPPALQPLVSDVLSTLQGGASGLLCQVSDVVGGTAVVFGVPCDQISSAAGLPIDSGATAPVSVSASVTLTGGILSAAATTLPSSTPPPLSSLLSSLSSSILSVAMTDTQLDASAASSAASADALANSALSGLSSLISQVSSLSLAATTPAALSSPLATPLATSLLETPLSSSLLGSAPATSDVGTLLSDTPIEVPPSVLPTGATSDAGTLPSVVPTEVSPSVLSTATSDMGTPISDVPTEVPDAPTEVSPSVLPTATSDVGTPINSDVPTEVPDAPTEVSPSVLPTATSDVGTPISDVPTEVPDAPTEVSPSVLPTATSDVGTPINSDVPTEVPDAPTEVSPSVLPTATSDVGTLINSDVPTEVPDAPTEVSPSVLPTATSDLGTPIPIVPTTATSNVPTAVPSSPLLNVTSDVGIPLSDAPTALPLSVLPNVTSDVGTPLTATSNVLASQIVTVTETANVETTILQVVSVTALVTSTSVQTSLVITCPSALASNTPSASSILGTGSGTGSGFGPGPCPGQGYTCDECLDGWFCPPVQTPAASVPCGFGWPCYHCSGGWFCVPYPQTVEAARPLASSTLSAVVPNAYLATNGYQYVGCYQDTSDTVLTDGQLMKLASDMTNDECINLCRSKSFAIAGTKSGTQCFCGNDLLGSVLVSNGQCNMSCAGDATQSTLCGGPEALSIWGLLDTSIQEESPEQSFSSAVTPEAQGTGGMAYTKMQITSSIYAWPPAETSVSDLPTSLAASDLSELEMAMLSVIASRARETQGTAGQGFIGSISAVLNMGTTNIADDVPPANLTSSTAFITESSSITLAPKPVHGLTAVPTDSTLYMTAMADDNTATHTAEANNPVDDMVANDASAAMDGDQVGSSAIPILPGTKRERRVPRRRSHWA